MSGFYLVKLTESVGGKQQYITFTVRDDDRASDRSHRRPDRQHVSGLQRLGRQIAVRHTDGP